MECFQPGLSSSPDCWAEISARSINKILVKYSERLHGRNFSPGRLPARAKISARLEIPGMHEISARAELIVNKSLKCA